MMNGTAVGRRKRDVSFNDADDMEAKLEKVRSGMATNLLTSNSADLLPLMNETMSKSFKLSEQKYKKVMQDVFPLLVCKKKCCFKLPQFFYIQLNTYF